MASCGAAAHLLLQLNIYIKVASRGSLVYCGSSTAAVHEPQYTRDSMYCSALVSCGAFLVGVDAQQFESFYTVLKICYFRQDYQGLAKICWLCSSSSKQNEPNGIWLMDHSTIILGWTNQIINKLGIQIPTAIFFSILLKPFGDVWLNFCS